MKTIKEILIQRLALPVTAAVCIVIITASGIMISRALGQTTFALYAVGTVIFIETMLTFVLFDKVAKYLGNH